MRIGFIGLGRMGGPMCERLLAAGHDLTVHDVRPEAARPLVERGAGAAAAARECAAGADVLITMLPSAREVEDVLLAGGVLEALPEGALAIDMSTSSPALARTVAEAAAGHGVSAADAPVAEATNVRAGALRIYLGAHDEDVTRALQVLGAFADEDRIRHVGPPGAGQTVKLLVNLQWFVHAVAAAEALLTGVRHGIDPRALHEVLADGPGSSGFMRREARELLEHGDYADGFPVSLVIEELELALGLARDAGVPADLAALTTQIYERARARYGDDAGELSAVRLLEDLAGARLRF